MAGLTHYLKQAWKKPTREMLQPKLIEWRAGNAVVKVDRPTRLDRAHSLGYKAKEGVIVARVRVRRGGRQIPRTRKGRKSKRMSPRKLLKMNYKWVAEGRAARYFNNLEVLNSYWIGKDGKHYFFEVILVDPNHPAIKHDKELSFMADPANRHRVQRGLTSAGRRSRGLRHKSPMSRARPSVRSHGRRGK
jgi:large subunit ribosomal protein L15e